MQKASHVTINTAIDSAFYGRDFGEALKNSYRNAFVDELAALGAGKIGSEYGVGSLVGGPSSADYWMHKGLHGALGCAGAAAKGGDCASGAGGAAIGEAVAESVGKGLVEDGDFSETDEKLVKIAGTTAAIYGVSAGGGDIRDAADASQNAIENNLFPALAVAAAANWLLDKAMTAHELYELGVRLEQAQTDQEAEDILAKFGMDKSSEYAAGAAFGAVGKLGVKGFKKFGKFLKGKARKAGGEGISKAIAKIRTPVAIHNGNITIGKKTFRPSELPEDKGGAKVFRNVSEQEQKKFLDSILKDAKLESIKGGGKIKVYVRPDKTKITVRTKSTSNDGNLNVDITPPRKPGQPKHKADEYKFK